LLAVFHRQPPTEVATEEAHLAAHKQGERAGDRGLILEYEAV
jgi:hypothetical protein